MAQKSNATIVPFAVIGDYKIGNDNLVVNYGEGFNKAKTFFLNSVLASSKDLSLILKPSP